MKASAVGSVVLALALSDLALASRLSLYKPRSHTRRDQLTAPSNSSGSPQPVALNDANDLRYLANITIGSEQKTVTIDTGSTDLVIFSTIAGAVDTGVPGQVTYAAGTASGNVFSATVEFAGQEIHHQAFLSTNVVDPSFGDGIMGIALFTESSIELALNSSPGAAPFLDNVFTQDTSTPNFVSFLLQREDDPDQDINAEFTIGEIVPGYENISSMPQIQVQSASESGHWQIFIDAVNGPDGKPIQFTTSVQGSPSPVGILDTGAPLALVPKAVSDAIYSGIPGAVLDNTILGGQDAYIVDCTAEAAASFVINGTTYPIHPLDLVVPMPLDNGTIICIGAFVPDELDSDFSFFDFLLGDPFVRNVYMVLNYGDFVASDTTQTKDAYVQLLPTTDLTVAHKEFQDARKSGSAPFTGGNNSNGNVGGSGGGSNNSTSGVNPSKDVTINQIKTTAETEADKVKHIAIIVAACVGGVVLLGIALCLVCCCGLCGFRKRNMRSFGMRGSETREAYRPLHAPVPQGHQGEYGYEGKGQLY